MLPPLRKRIGKRWVALVAFGGLFVALFVIVGVADGIGHPSVPAGAVAVVEDAPDGTITKQDFDDALTQAAAQQELPKAPSPSSPQYGRYGTLRCQTVLLSRWILGEAEERGITISDTEISNQLKQIAEQQFGGQKQFQQGIKQLGYTPQQARDVVEGNLISRPRSRRRRSHNSRPSPNHRSRTTTRPTSPSSPSPRPATFARSSTAIRPRSSRPRRFWNRTTRRRTGTRSPPSTRPTRRPRTAAAFVGE